MFKIILLKILAFIGIVEFRIKEKNIIEIIVRKLNIEIQMKEMLIRSIISGLGLVYFISEAKNKIIKSQS